MTRLLAPTGHLLILVDIEGCSESDPEIKTVEGRGGKLLAHAVPAQLLGRTNRTTIIKTLKRLQTTARDEITHLRKQEPTSRSGRLHALWTQQLANADLELQTLE